MGPLVFATAGDEEKVTVLATLQQGSAAPRHVCNERGWRDLDDTDGERILDGLRLGLGLWFRL